MILVSDINPCQGCGVSLSNLRLIVVKFDNLCNIRQIIASQDFPVVFSLCIESLTVLSSPTMFLTFGSSRGTDEHPCNPKHAKRSRRRSTAHACTSCRRRKIKCDGEKPCEACQWYKTPELCLYPGREPSQR
jgi:hypothetical protein